MAIPKTAYTLCRFFIKETNYFVRRIVTTNLKDLDPANWILREENNGVHKLLEELPAYQDHVIPHPRLWFASERANNVFSRLETSARAEFSKEAQKHAFECSEHNRVEISHLLHDGKWNYKITEHKYLPGSRSLDSLIQEYRQCSIQDNTEPAKLTDSTLPKLIKHINEKLFNASDIEFTQIMIYTCFWMPNRLSEYPKFGSLWSKLDNESCRRFPTWSLEQKLLIADLWYHLYLGRVCKFTTMLINSIPDILQELQKQHLVHLLFVINLKRKVRLEIMQTIEPKLEACIDSFSIDEIAVIALAHFKTSTKITSAVLINTIAERLIAAAPTASTLVLNSIVKTLRLSFRYENRHLISKLLQEFCKSAPWCKDFKVATHLCLLANSHNAYVPEFMDCVTSDMTKMENVRLKDLAKILFTLSRFWYVDKNKGNNLTDFFIRELRSPKRKIEIDTFPYSFLSCLLYLAYMGTYLQQEINLVLSESFQAHLGNQEYLDFYHELATLDCLVEIDEPTYTGHRLDCEKRRQILTKTHHYFPSNRNQKTFRETATEKISVVLRNIFKKDLPMLHILPYMDDPVFLLIFDKRGQLCKPPAKFMDSVSAGRITGPTNNNVWVVVWLLTKKDCIEEHDLVGLSKTKERHFKKLGFKVLIVPYSLLNVNHLPKCQKYLEENLKSILLNSSVM